jgi:hypothetical protein
VFKKSRLNMYLTVQPSMVTGALGTALVLTETDHKTSSPEPSREVASRFVGAAHHNCSPQTTPYPVISGK